MPSLRTSDDPIKHVIVLTLENRSFDQMVGCLREIHTALDGISGDAPGENRDGEGVVYRQMPTTERQIPLDPRHEIAHVAAQLADHNGGFVKDFAASYPDCPVEARQLIMSYYPLGFLPALHALGRDFTVCDRWFASVPGPTWPNRFFALTGTANGRVNMPGDGTHKADLAGYFQQDQVTLFDRLTEQGRHWKVYFHDIPQSWVLCGQRRPENAARYFYFDEFFDDCRAPEAEFPEFCFIEPDYMGTAQNDDHPPHDVMKAEKLIADIYNALRANEALWRSTLFVLFYDEHGGFYDHVEPPPAVPPDSHREEFGFDRLGVRVPALLVSPWVDRGVEKTQFDHTSLLKYLTEKWNLGPLGDRTAQAASLGVALRRTLARDDGDMIPRIELTLAQLTPPDPALEEKGCQSNTHQSALEKLGLFLRTEADEDLPRLLSGIARAIETAILSLSGMARRLRRLPAHPRVSIAEPDKLARASALTQDDAARFTMRRKVQALPALAARIRDGALSLDQRNHAVHTLALITGRPFHREADGIAAASSWLQG